MRVFVKSLVPKSRQIWYTVKDNGIHVTVKKVQNSEQPPDKEVRIDTNGENQYIGF